MMAARKGLLVYCLTEREVSPPLPAGVDGEPVSAILPLATTTGGAAPFVCYFSHHQGEGGTTSAQATSQRALEFFAVIKHVFAAGDTIQFRFPTVFVDSDALEKHLRDGAAHYRQQFEVVRGKVQMELRVGAPSVRDTTSGTAYMHSLKSGADRAERIRGQILSASLAEKVIVTQQDPGLRVFALVTRGCDMVFRRKVEELELGGLEEVQVTGPWPPMAFVQGLPE